MKIVPGLLLLLAVACIGYGYWGAFTQQGNQVYDEMDALLPFFIMTGGIVLLLVCVIVWILAKRKKNRSM